LHTTLEGIAKLAHAAADRAGGNGVHGDLGRIARLAEEAQERPVEYVGVLLRELMVVARFDPNVRDGLEGILSKVGFVLLVEGSRYIPISLGQLVEVGGQACELVLNLDGGGISPQLKLPLC